MENTKAGGRGASDKGRAKAKRSEAEGMRGAPPHTRSTPGPVELWQDWNEPDLLQDQLLHPLAHRFTSPFLGL